MDPYLYVVYSGHIIRLSDEGPILTGHGFDLRSLSCQACQCKQHQAPVCSWTIAPGSHNMKGGSQANTSKLHGSFQKSGAQI